MTSRRVILMYISEVSGHHRATSAVEKALKILEPKTEVLNLNGFNYTNPLSEKIINRLYMSVIRSAPRIWDYLYDNPVVARKIARIKDSVHKFNSPKLKKLFDGFKPDVVACSQAFPCGMCADYKKASGSHIKLVGMLTDYIPHSYWIYDTVDYYVTPSEDISRHLINRGVPPQKVKAFGIPFDPVFTAPLDRRAAKRKLDLDPDDPVILIMGGGHGIGPMRTIVHSLERSRYFLQEIVVTGVNVKLYNALKRGIKRRRQRVLLFQYTENIHELMKAADIIVTKPGGVTTAEVLAQALPMIIIKPLPGQETHNASYLTHKGAAISVDTPAQMHLVIDDLLDNPHKIQSLCDGTRHLSKPEAGFDIARLLLELP